MLVNHTEEEPQARMPDHPEKPAFEDLTETTGIPLSAEGASMMFTRYAYAASLAQDKAVLELGCGSGQGFGLLREAGQILGGDASLVLLRQCQSHYRSRVPLVQLSADALPLQANSFDLVLLFEASYYVPNMARAFGEIDRVLRPGGQAVFVNANPERPDFIHSPHSVYYHTADEFRTALEHRGYQMKIEGAFPLVDANASAASLILGKLFTWTRRILETFRLIPKTLRGRARLKRLLSKKSVLVPSELTKDFAPPVGRTELRPGPVLGYKVIYTTATKDHSQSLPRTFRSIDVWAG